MPQDLSELKKRVSASCWLNFGLLLRTPEAHQGLTDESALNSSKEGPSIDAMSKLLVCLVDREALQSILIRFRGEKPRSQMTELQKHHLSDGACGKGT